MRKISLLDALSLRRSSVYKNPRAISFLNIAFGDFSRSFIPCTPIDRDGRLFHASDLPMQIISRVNVDEKPVTSGYKTFTAYQDETGRSIACVIFDQPQTGSVSVSGKGTVKMDTGELIENPADYIRTVLLDIQGYDESSINAGELARLYSECLKSDLKMAALLSEDVTLKSLFDSLALNIHAHWLISASKSVMRLRSRASNDPIRYEFKDDGSDSLDMEITSEDIVNEVTVNYCYNHATGKYLASMTKHNPQSKLLYGAFPKTFDLDMVMGARQVEEIIDARLRTYSIPQLFVTIRHNLLSIHIEEGDRVSITHPQGIGVNGFVDATGIITARQRTDIEIKYEVAMDTDDNLFASELVNLSQASSGAKLSISVAYTAGFATITVHALPKEIQVSGYERDNGSFVDPYYRREGNEAPLPGADIIIDGTKKTTDAQGQVVFELSPGSYIVKLSAAGYDPQEVTFTV